MCRCAWTVLVATFATACSSDGSSVDGSAADGTTDVDASKSDVADAGTDSGKPVDAGAGADAAEAGDAGGDAKGDAGTPHVVFVSSTSFGSGALGGLAGADGKCTTLALAAGFSGSWRAILSDSNTAASSHITVTGPIRDTLGSVVATGAADLWDGTIGTTLSHDENKANVSSALVFTGTAPDGTGDFSIPNGSFCGDWTSTSGGVEAGWTTQVNGDWIAHLPSSPGQACNAAARLYCISQ